LRDAGDRFGEAGAGVVLIGLGEPHYAAGFCAERDVPHDCVVQPDRSAHKAFGLRRGTTGELLGPANWAPWLKNQVTGKHQGAFGQGDPAQLPGTFVVDTGGIVRFAHRGKRSSDVAKVEDVLAVAASLGDPS